MTDLELQLEQKRLQMRQKAQKKKREFMQCVVITSYVIFFLCVTASYILGYLDKLNPLENLSIAVVTTPIVTTLAYALQNCTRAKW